MTIDPTLSRRRARQAMVMAVPPLLLLLALMLDFSDGSWWRVAPMLLLPPAVAYGVTRQLTAEAPSRRSLLVTPVVTLASAASWFLMLALLSGADLLAPERLLVLKLLGIPIGPYWWLYHQLDRRLVLPRPTSGWAAFGRVAAGLAGVGLLLFSGLLMGVANFAAQRDAASDVNARNQVRSALSLVEEYAAANQGAYPVGFSKLWRLKRPDDYNLSPWGGERGACCPDGVLELPSVVGSYASAEAAEAGGQAPAALQLAPDPSRKGVMIFVRIVPGPSGEWIALRAGPRQRVVAARGYAVGIYDREGTPWFHAEGGQ